MKTTEGNKLIAEFMGWEENEHHWCLNGDDDLQYHTSWDWLMPVVYKVMEALDSNKEMFSKYFQGYNMHGTWFTMFLPESIEALYKDVVEFIQWYNENK